MQASNHFITGLRYRLFELRMLWQLQLTALSVYSSKRTALRALWMHLKTHLGYKRAVGLKKAVKVGRRYYVQMGFPGTESKGLKTLTINELNRHIPIPGHQAGLNLLLLAITKKCSLQCAHCFEWDNLNQHEQLSANDVLQIIRKFQTNGVASIELSGGEPLNRYTDLLRIVRESETALSDFWLITSGYRLTAERALELKQAGLTGVCISLDHWDAAQHDAFRGLEGSFDWALQAAQNARDAGMVLGLGLTAVRNFCTPAHLMRYAQLAKDHGAHFIRVLEPRSVGHYSGMDVELGAKEIEVLEAFMFDLQTKKAYRNYPIIDYYPAYQRKAGCSGAGQRFLYVDTDGDMHACPFCQNKCGNVLCDGIENGRKRMQQASDCHVFPMA